MPDLHFPQFLLFFKLILIWFFFSSTDVTFYFLLFFFSWNSLVEFYSISIEHERFLISFYHLSYLLQLTDWEITFELLELHCSNNKIKLTYELISFILEKIFFRNICSNKFPNNWKDSSVACIYYKCIIKHMIPVNVHNAYGL